MVARRREQLFRNIISTCYVILYCLFYLILRSQQTQCSNQIENSYKKKCRRYRKIASQVKTETLEVKGCSLVSPLLHCHYTASKMGTIIILLQVSSP